MALLLTLVMILGAMGIDAGAAGNKADARIDDAHVFTEAENALLENDVFALISSVQADAAQTMGGIGSLTEANYISMFPSVIEAIKSSETYVEGTLQQNGIHRNDLSNLNNTTRTTTKIIFSSVRLHPICSKKLHRGAFCLDLVNRNM